MTCSCNNLTLANDIVICCFADNNVLFTFFNGEAYDYIGSGRTVFSMKNGEFPFRERSINKEDIRIFIELSQLSNNKTVFSHYIKNDKVMANRV